jgi:hypothetical protein
VPEEAADAVGQLRQPAHVADGRPPRDLLALCSRGDQQEGAPLVLFSRLPIRAVEKVPTAGRRPRLLAELALDRGGDGRTLMVVGVHPTSPSPTDPQDSWVRNLQLDGLAERAEGASGLVIVAGDFNTTPWSPYFRACSLRRGFATPPRARAGSRPGPAGFGGRRASRSTISWSAARWAWPPSGAGRSSAPTTIQSSRTSGYLLRFHKAWSSRPNRAPRQAPEVRHDEA